MSVSEPPTVRTDQTNRESFLARRFGPRPATSSVAINLIVAYLVAMPFLAGLPRGTVLPLLRPSEALQMGVTGVGVAILAVAMIDGKRWRLRIGRLEWSIIAMTVAASVLPLLWLMARSQPVGPVEVMAVFPFIKYSVLFLLARICITSEHGVAAVAKAMIGTGLVIAAISVAQALGVGPVLSVLTRFFVSSADDVIDGGRGTTTIGSSIATGAYLAMVCGLGLSWGLATGNRLLLAAAAVLAVGALGSGQAGTVLALGVIILVVAYRHGRLGQLMAWSIPLSIMAMIGLWPIVAARLADVDQGSGLPQSWIIRWNNVSELYLPSLADGGWLLGVNPNAIQLPPDVWRDVIYLESGYLWLLWVGGVPLLLAALFFLATAWSDLGTANAYDNPPATPSDGQTMMGIRVGAQAAVAMVATLSVLDPHLTLRAGADTLFVLIAAGVALRPIAVPNATAPARWRALLAADVPMSAFGGARLQFRETNKTNGAEAAFALTVQNDGASIGGATLTLHRRGPGLRGIVDNVHGGAAAHGLAWRAMVMMADELRLEQLRWQATPVGQPMTREGAAEETIGAAAERSELKLGAAFAEELEIERVAMGHRFSRVRVTAERSAATNADPLPGIRLDPGVRVPRWKRVADMALGSLALVLTAPLWLFAAAAVGRSSPGPILYRQVRIGTGGLPFQIYKFRTMYIDNDDAAHRLQNKLELRGEADATKDSDDPRITPVGKWLRRLSLDELPQLINVMRSEMSLVGPRPSLVWESELFAPEARRRLTARPGLTGLWQISGRADISMSEMLDLDLEYVDHMGPMIDLRCLVGTVTSVAAGEGAR